MDIAPYIKELILLNECVILPDFGGFETRYAPAEYNSKQERMLPPTKHIHFRNDYQKGGEVLCDHLCKRLNIDYAEAETMVSNYVTALKQKLEDSREAIVEEVGLFTMGLGQSLNFTPFEDQNYLAESFGLDALDYKQTQPVASEQPKKKELKINSRHNSLLLVVIGIFVVILLMGLTIFISSRFDVYLFNLGDSDTSGEMLILGNTTKLDSVKQEIDQTIEGATDLRAALLYEPVENNNTLTGDYYYLVAGSFKSERNAQVLESELSQNGFHTLIIENKGYYRVTIGQFYEKQEALLELKRLRRQLNRSVWLLMITND